MEWLLLLSLLLCFAFGALVVPDVGEVELLDNSVSSIPAQKRQQIAAKLEARGFDLSGITGGTTIRAALVNLFTQDNVAF